MLLRIGSFTLLLVAVGAVVLVPGVTIMAQDDRGTTSSTSALKWVDHVVVKGGWITWFVLIPLSVATVALAIEH
ncbi:MAG: hypothetical protein ACYS7M_12275, partial [Planctomycetota bacterium]